MFAPACSSQSMGCTSVNNGDPTTAKRRADRLKLVGTASFVIVRDLQVIHTLDLSEVHTDFFDELVSHLIEFIDAAGRHIDRQGLASSDLVLDQNVALAGQLGGGGGGASVTTEAIFDSNTSAGQVVYVSGDGHVDLAQADNYLTATAVGIATQDVLAGETGEYITVGPVTTDTWTLTAGTVYYLDPAVPGGMTTTYPDNSGEFVVILGAAATSTQLNLEIHWMLEQ